MRKISLTMMWLAVASLMTMVSCRKPNQIDVPGATHTVTFNANTESSSKTNISGLDVLWSEGDVISVNGETIGITGGTGTSCGTFSGEIGTEAPYYVGYPAASTKYTSDPKTLKLNIPASLDYEPGKVVVPMAAYTASDGGDLNFSNAVNMLKFKLTGNGSSASKLLYITLTNTEATSYLNGDITVTFDGENASFSYAQNGTNSTTVNFGSGLPLTSTEQTVYIAFPKIPSGNLKVCFICANYNCMEKTITYDSQFNNVNNIFSPKDPLMVNALTPFVGIVEEWINFNDPEMEVYNMPIWSKKNLGATNGSTKESWYGDYYAWGATTTWYEPGYAYENPQTHWKTSPKDYSNGYSWANAPYSMGEGSELLGPDFSKYNNTDGINVLEPDDDAAYKNATPVNTWRIPTGGSTGEWKRLLDNTYLVWNSGYKEISGLNGYVVYKVKSKLDKGAHDVAEAPSGEIYTLSDPHLFLPAAGNRSGTDLDFFWGWTGAYWSSTRSNSFFGDCAYGFGIMCGAPNADGGYDGCGRNVGASVRPVRDVE